MYRLDLLTWKCKGFVETDWNIQGGGVPSPLF